MRVVITGGGGFIGQKLAKVIAQQGALNGQRVDKLTLFDINVPDRPESNRIDVDCVAGDIAEPNQVKAIIGTDCDVIYHLAAVVSGAAEADLDLGMRVNLDGTRNVLEAARHLPRPAMLIYTSSLAAYGGDALPEIVGDNVELNPQNSYGMQKVVGELLINDYSRRGLIDGRSLRLPTVVVRPGKANAAASSFASAVAREPLQGDAYVCPVPVETKMWIASPRAVVKNLQHAATLSAESLGSNRALGLPGLTVSIEEVLGAMRRVAGDAPVKLVSFEPDQRIIDIVSGWCYAFAPQRAVALGFAQDEGIDSIIRAFIEDDRVT